ncbi:MAG: hypothetical protein QNM02_19850 [Acidimicrobiia bacterium]|nr:hypothetical protein [Acidimicrobiia bacterium]
MTQSATFGALGMAGRGSPRVPGRGIVQRTPPQARPALLAHEIGPEGIEHAVDRREKPPERGRRFIVVVGGMSGVFSERCRRVGYLDRSGQCLDVQLELFEGLRE